MHINEEKKGRSRETRTCPVAGSKFKIASRARDRVSRRLPGLPRMVGAPETVPGVRPLRPLRARTEGDKTYSLFQLTLFFHCHFDITRYNNTV